jgi:hypothetical protein
MCVGAGGARPTMACSRFASLALPQTVDGDRWAAWPHGDVMHTSNRPAPIFGVLSVALTPVAALIVFLAQRTIEALVGRPSDGLIHATALFGWACVAAGLASAPLALVRRERPRWLPVFGLVLTLCLIGLLFYLADH